MIFWKHALLKMTYAELYNRLKAVFSYKLRYIAGFWLVEMAQM